MSYQVLARKWRPRTFSEVCGQHHVLTPLIQALDHKRLHHAYLFSGTRGVGKTTLGRLLAKGLNCERGVSSTPCGVCDTCREIDAGTSMDLIEVDAASRTKVEDTRDLLDNVQYRPVRNRFKVYLIDEAHMLSRHSFNALLKTLEEPPDHVKFILATTEPNKLPATVVSRCLQFHLKILTLDHITQQFARILSAENITSEPDALTLLAQAAQGSMRDGLSLLDQALSYNTQRLETQAVVDMLGVVHQTHVHQLLDALVQGNASVALAKVNEIVELGPDFDVIHAQLERFLYRIALAQFVPEADTELDSADIQRFAELLSPEDIQLFYQIVLHGRRDLPYAPDLRTGFEMTVLRLLAFEPQSDASTPAPRAGEISQPEARQNTSPPVQSAPLQPQNPQTLTPASTPKPQAINPASMPVDAPKTQTPVQPIPVAKPLVAVPHPEVQTPHSVDPESVMHAEPEEDVSSVPEPQSQVLDELFMERIIQKRKELQSARQGKTLRTQSSKRPDSASVMPKVDNAETTQVLAKPVAPTEKPQNAEAWIEAANLRGMARQIVLDSVLTYNGTKAALAIAPKYRNSCTPEQQKALHQQLQAVNPNVDLDIQFAQEVVVDQTLRHVHQQRKCEQLQALQEDIARDPKLNALLKPFDGAIDFHTLQPIDDHQ